jgi:DNA polymerase III delta subunit
MGAITLRNLPAEIDTAIRQRAEQDGVSLNQAVIRLLSENIRPAKNQTYHDLDDLCGVLSDEEADEIDAAIAEQSQIEPTDWTDEPGTGWKAPWA